MLIRLKARNDKNKKYVGVLLYVKNIPIKKIDKEIDRLNKFSTVTKQTLECKQTGKEFTTDVKLDPADFFVVT